MHGELLKKLALGLGKAMLALVIVFAIFAGYGYYAEKSASKKATAMCNSIATGTDSLPIRDRAIADGASDFQTRWFKQDGIDILLITYVGVPPFSRHICQVRSSNGQVTSANLSYLD